MNRTESALLTLLITGILGAAIFSIGYTFVYFTVDFKNETAVEHLTYLRLSLVLLGLGFIALVNSIFDFIHELYTVCRDYKDKDTL